MSFNYPRAIQAKPCPRKRKIRSPPVKMKQDWICQRWHRYSTTWNEYDSMAQNYGPKIFGRWTLINIHQYSIAILGFTRAAFGDLPGRWMSALRPPQPKKMPRPVRSSEVATPKWSPAAAPAAPSKNRNRSTSPRKLIRPSSKAAPPRGPRGPTARPPLPPEKRLSVHETSTGLRPQPPPMTLYQESQWGCSDEREAWNGMTWVAAQRDELMNCQHDKMRQYAMICYDILRYCTVRYSTYYSVTSICIYI